MLLLAVPLSATSLTAQDPQLRPLSTFLEAAGSNPSISDFRYVMRRCGALYTLFAATIAEGDSATAAAYQTQSMAFAVMAAAADRRLGVEDNAEAAEITYRAMQEIVTVYKARMVRNMALTGSYFAEDPLIRNDAEVCRSVAESKQ